MNEKKKVPLKKYGLLRGVTRTVLLEGGLLFSRVNGNVSKRGFDEKGLEKKNRGGGCNPQRKDVKSAMKMVLLIVSM